MNIKYKSEEYEYRLIGTGEFFMYEGCLYLKIATSNEKYSAFNCTQETLTGFVSSVLVRPINMIIQEV